MDTRISEPQVSRRDPWVSALHSNVPVESKPSLRTEILWSPRNSPAAMMSDMRIGFRGKRPRIADGAWVAPTAVVRGDVTIGEGSVVLYGAVITAEGGPVAIGADCVIMENAVLRGTPRNPLTIADRVLVGPHAHLTGCRVDADAFVATGAAVFNGAHLQEGSEVRIHGVVHVNSRVPPGEVVPIGWVAVGDPAAILPPERHDEIWRIQRELDFPGTVFSVGREIPRGERTRRFAKALQRHREDEPVSE